MGEGECQRALVDAGLAVVADGKVAVRVDVLAVVLDRLEVREGLGARLAAGDLRVEQRGASFVGCMEAVWWC